MLAMAGALDGMAPFAKAMASDMPDVKLMVIPRANHLTAFNDEFIEAGVKFWGHDSSLSSADYQTLADY